ncbi:MAG: hypothetical protein IJ233_10900, partial [Pyramidobacter sp.]|nr:hypothetical protein [Pyramidobacter sp.]
MTRNNVLYQPAAPSNTLIATHGIDVSAPEKAFANFDGRLPMPSQAIGRRRQQGATHYNHAAHHRRLTIAPPPLIMKMPSH